MSRGNSGRRDGPNERYSVAGSYNDTNASGTRVE